jgi:hypothetical protein
MSLKRRVEALDGGEYDPDYLPQDVAIHLLHALDQPDPVAAMIALRPRFPRWVDDWLARRGIRPDGTRIEEAG